MRFATQVEAQDTSVIAQLGWPDMRLPLLYSLSWPHRVRMSYDQLDLAKLCTCIRSLLSRVRLGPLPRIYTRRLAEALLRTADSRRCIVDDAPAFACLSVIFATSTPSRSRRFRAVEVLRRRNICALHLFRGISQQSKGNTLRATSQQTSRRLPLSSILLSTQTSCGS